MRLFGRRTPDIEKLRRKNDADGLVAALRWEDPVTDRDGRFVDLGVGVRCAAVEALADLDSSVAFEGLLRALRDPEHDVRREAVRALRQRGDRDALGALVAAVNVWVAPGHEPAREDAVQALCDLGDRDAGPQLAHAMLTRAPELDPEDSAILARVVGASGPEAAAEVVADLVARLATPALAPRARTLLIALAAHSTEALIGALRDEGAQREAALALGSIHDSRAVSALCSLLLGDADPPVRAAAAWALGEIRDPGGLEALLGAVADREYEVRTAAGASFDRFGNAAIAVAMGAMLRAALENGGPAPAQVLPAASPSPPSPSEMPQLQRPPAPLRTGRGRPRLRRLLGR